MTERTKPGISTRQVLLFLDDLEDNLGIPPTVLANIASIPLTPIGIGVDLRLANFARPYLAIIIS